jgi:hypothetical protein
MCSHSLYTSSSSSSSFHHLSDMRGMPQIFIWKCIKQYENVWRGVFSFYTKQRWQFHINTLTFMNLHKCVVLLSYSLYYPPSCFHLSLSPTITSLPPVSLPFLIHQFFSLFYSPSPLCYYTTLSSKILYGEVEEIKYK